MAIIKWSPAREIASLQQGINRLFEDVFSQPGSYDADAMGARRPPVDIVDTQEAILIFVEIPGVDKEEVAIEVKDNVLSIQG
jgi:HSP20 family protein